MFGNSSKIYNVYINSAANDSVEEMVLVPEGFSFMAFILNLFWALYHRIWSLAFLTFAVLTILELLYIEKILPEDMTLILRLVFSLWVGFEANDWRSASLERRGYALVDLVSGANEENAKIRFLDKNISTSHSLVHA